MTNQKRVAYVIKVPIGKYCWNFTVSSDKCAVCQYFSNEGGNPSCNINFQGQQRTKDGVLKSPQCMALKEI